MKFTIGKRIAIGYVLAIVALIILGFTVHQSTQELVQSNEFTKETYHLLLEAEDVLADVKDAELGLRGYVVAKNELFLQRFEEATNAYNLHIKHIRDMAASHPGLKEKVEELDRQVIAKLGKMSVLVQTRKDSETNDVTTFSTTILASKTELDGIRKSVRDIMDEGNRELDDRQKKAKTSADNSELTILWGTAIATLLLVVIGVGITNSISRPLGQVTAVANQIATGDISVAINTTAREDEIGELTNAFARMSVNLRQAAETTREIAAGNLTVSVRALSEKDVVGNALADMTKNLGGLIGQVQRSGIQVNTSVAEIAATAKQQQATATEIAGTTAEIGATSRQISATSQELVKTMNEVAGVAVETTQLAGAGRQSLNRMEVTMGQLVEAAGTINSRLAVLNEKAGNINQVVTTINKVADQTNLLSLNAAIEAEKAGEYGRGFAVVATEIRRLADQTAVATYDIEQMVKEMQTAVSAGVMSMDKFSEEVRRGVDEVGKVGKQLAQIIEQVQALAPRFDSVNDGMQTQSTGAQQISEALTQLSDAVQQTAESLRQSNAAIEQLNDAASGLRTSVTRFKVLS